MADIKTITVNGITYNVKDDTSFSASGGTLTGPLTLAGAPTADLHAATKQYVDDGDKDKLNKTGDTMTGALTLSGEPSANLHAATKQYVDNKQKSVTVTLTVANWSSSNTQTVSVNGVTTSNMVFIAPAPASFLAYCDAQVRATAQAANSLTFTCESKPEAALTVNIGIFG